MTTERRITLAIVVSPDGTKCAAECPFLCEPKDEDGIVDAGFCLLPDEADLASDEEGSWLRNAKCIAASEAAREAEVDAVRRVVDAVDAKGGGFGEHDRLLFDAEIERVRRGAP